MFTRKADSKVKPGRAVIISSVLLFFLLISHFSYSQFYNGSQVIFGKNRVQYREFLWTFYKFDDFDIYFYRNGRSLAESVARYATEQLPVMEKRLGTSLDAKIRFIVYNNLSDFKQSNITKKDQQNNTNTGGVTTITGAKVPLYFDGNLRNFQRQIRAGIAEVLIDQINKGSTVGSNMKNDLFRGSDLAFFTAGSLMGASGVMTPTVPSDKQYSMKEWYKSGLISYLAEDWNADMDGWVRDGILSGRFDKYKNLTGQEALYCSHLIWKYVADNYGSNAVTDIVAMTKISRSVENGFLYVLGVSFKSFYQSCMDYYREIYQAEEEIRHTPDGQDLKRARKHRVYHRYMAAPDGQHAVYVDYDFGKFHVRLKDLHTGKKKRLLTGGFRFDEKIDYTYPLLSWHPSGRILAMIVERRGEVYLYFYNLEERSYQRVIMYSFEKVIDFSYSPDGRYFIMSAVQKGQSDLYLYNIAAGSHQQLTNDIYDDLDPTFFEGTHKILFASNRPNDTLMWGTDEMPSSVPRTTDLFILQRNDTRMPLIQISKTPYANEIQPRKVDEGYFMYLSDGNGIYNRYKGTFDSTISHVDTTVHYRFYTSTYPVTNYSRNILYHYIDPGTNVLSQIIYRDNRYHLQREEVLPPSLVDTVSLIETQQHNMSEAKQKEEEKEKKLSDIKEDVGRFTKRFKNVYFTEKQEQPPVKESDEVDIDNYVFDRQAFLTIHKEDTTVREAEAAKGEKEEDEFVLPKRLNYRTEYSFSELTTQLDFMALNYFYQPIGTAGISGYSNKGLNGFIQVSATDLLENYEITAGIRIPTSLNNFEYLLGFANRKKRLDREVLFVRQADENEYYYSYYTFIERFRSYQLYYILTYPLNPALAVRGTANFRYQKITWLSTNEPALREPDLNEYWGGVKAEVVYDDTKELGANLYVGTRFKIFGEYTQVLGPDAKSMFVTGLDVRHYLPVHRSLIWANRLAASTSFGKNRLLYYMGGVDNWIYPRTDYSNPVDGSMNYAYQTLATPMRGFHQNARNGNNFVLVNSELRFPVFRYFYNRPIRSDFLYNFQLIGFGDVGLAWSGPDPYSEENSFYIRYIEDGSLLIKIREQKEPLIGGFGFGARARLAGYFIRVDLAWGVEDRAVKDDPVLYFSLGLDF